MSNLIIPEARQRSWISIDPAKNLGFAEWMGGVLQYTGTCRAITKTEVKAAHKRGVPWADARCFVVDRKPVGGSRHEPVVTATMYDAFYSLVYTCKNVVIEEPFGKHVKSVAMMAWLRGYIAAIAASTQAKYTEVNNSEWTRVAAEAWGVSWPRDSELRKQLAIKLVKDHYDVDCTGYDDEADAVLVGAWALRTRTVEPTL